VVGEVHPYVFGNFAEHLGRCIYGGIFEEGSPLSDADGFRKGRHGGREGLGVTLLRWPGGNFSPATTGRTASARATSAGPPRPGLGRDREQPLRHGRVPAYAEKLGVEPYVCINAGLGTVEDARNWVEYTNEASRHLLGQQRRKNGRDKPWNVKIWGLGNELDGPWQLGHKNAEDYAKFALEAAKAMRRADTSIKLIASGSSNFGPGADWVGWNRTVLDRLKSEIDYISLHTYIGNREGNLEKFLAVSRDLDDRIEVVKGQIQATRVGNAKARPIYIAFDEWNSWYRTITPGMTEAEIGATGLEEKYDFADALSMGMFLNSFIRHADVVKMANLAQLVNVIAPIFTNKQGLYLQTTYFPIAEYAKQRGLTSLDVLVSLRNTSPTPGGSSATSTCPRPTIPSRSRST
jgi:alpha-N-arabinofuranosidase